MKPRLLKDSKSSGISRREFLKITGASGLGVLMTSSGLSRMAYGQNFDLLRVFMNSEATGSIDVVRARHTKATQHARDHANFLVNVDPTTLEIKAGLATEWSRNEDATEYSFTLREDVSFHDGTPFNADAVKANFDNIAEFAGGSGYSALGADSYMETIVNSGNSLTVRFSEPHVTFYGQLALRLWFDSPTLVEEFGEDYGVEAFATTGAFRVTSFTSGDNLMFERNDAYAWAPSIYDVSGPPAAAAMEIRGVREGATRLSGLLSGEADIVMLVEGDVPTAQAEGFNVIMSPKAGTTRQLRFNLGKAPLNDINVRRALAHAIDRDVLVNSARYSGIGSEAFGILGRPNMGVTDWPEALVNASIGFDPEAANSLLNGAGWAMGADGVREKDGERLSLDMVIPASFEAEVLPIQSMWSDVGAEMVISIVSTSAWFDAQETGEFDVIIASNSGTGLVLINRVYQTGGTGNFWGLSDPELDADFDIVAQSLDDAARFDANIRAQARIMDQAYAVPTVEVVFPFGVQEGVSGIFFPEFSWPSFYPVRKA